MKRVYFESNGKTIQGVLISSKHGRGVVRFRQLVRTSNPFGFRQSVFNPPVYVDAHITLPMDKIFVENEHKNGGKS